MPVFCLPSELIFPDPALAEPDGLIAIGGDLSAERLLLGYQYGIFPWFSRRDPIMWWSPDPRFVLFPENFKVSASLSALVRKGKYRVTFDTDFANVIKHCADVKRTHETGTWITADMKKAYINLHHLGFAHSVETWQEDRLVGGLYGISLGKAFFGESMFHTATDASKVALFHLVQQLKTWKFDFIDSQLRTEHLVRLGAEEIPREKYLNLLDEALLSETLRGKWT
ncbi:MAG: leucyl/phenylalanyl-tRNA--protein transferase [Bacteroidota bacterium]